MSDKPNVTVIYQETKAPGPGLGAILLDLLGLALFVGVAAIIGSCGFFR